MSDRRMRRRTLGLATAHVDLHRFAPAAYERRVGGFLQPRLRSA